MKSAPAIAFDYRPSRIVAGACVIVGVAATIAPWLSALPAAACAAVSLATLGAGVRSLRAFLGERVRRIAYGANGWSLADADDMRAADLRAHARLGSWLMLDFRDGRAHRLRALFGPDNLDADTRRRLRLLLSRGEIARPQ